MNVLDKALVKWETLDDKKRQNVLVVGIVVVSLIIGYFLWPKNRVDSTPRTAGRTAPSAIETHVFGGGQSNVQAIRDLSARLDGMERVITERLERADTAARRLDQARENFEDWTKRTDLERQASQARRELESLTRDLETLREQKRELERPGDVPRFYQPGEARPEPTQGTADVGGDIFDPSSRRGDRAPLTSERPAPDGGDDILASELLAPGAPGSLRPPSTSQFAPPGPRAADAGAATGQPQPRPTPTLFVNGHTTAQRTQQSATAHQQDARAASTELRRNTPTIDEILPPGTILSGVMLHGVDAPTGSQARSHPPPVLFRVTELGVLPNLFGADLRECFILGAARGSMSEERAFVRTEDISCVTEDRHILTSKLHAYAVGSDGKTGLRGPVVQRTGALIGRSILAGMFSGFGNALGSRRRGVFITSDPRSTESLGDIAQEGAFQGVGSSFDRIAQYYLDRASELYPVIEIDSGTMVDIVLTQSLDVGTTTTVTVAQTAAPQPSQHSQDAPQASRGVSE